ncbi:MAG: universal stress protein [Candidatus Obscuribacterales bacterium]
MKTGSYLLVIDGSQASRSAAHFAWQLASLTNSRVDAQHVVDTADIWRFLSYDLAGFIGSGPYMDARQRITQIQRSIADALMLSYSSQAGGQALAFETFIDEGDPACEITKRAIDYDLVLLGFHARGSNLRSKILFEEVAKLCPCPLLVVRDVVKRWSKMQIFITSDMAGPETIQSIFQVGALLAVPVEVLLDSRDSTLVALDRERFSMGGWSSAFGVNVIRSATFKEVTSAADENVLLVVSADAFDSSRDTLVRTRIEKFIQGSASRALLLWRDRASSRGSVRMAS